MFINLHAMIFINNKDVLKSKIWNIFSYKNFRVLKNDLYLDFEW